MVRVSGDRQTPRGRATQPGFQIGGRRVGSRLRRVGLWLEANSGTGVKLELNAGTLRWIPPRTQNAHGRKSSLNARSSASCVARARESTVASVFQIQHFWPHGAMCVFFSDAKAANPSFEATESTVAFFLRRGVLLRSADAATRRAFRPGAPHGTALIDLFVDGAGLFDSAAGATSVYATMGEFPFWFRETEAAWVKLASFPDESVAVMGLPCGRSPNTRK